MSQRLPLLVAGTKCNIHAQVWVAGQHTGRCWVWVREMSSAGVQRH